MDQSREWPPALKLPLVGFLAWLMPGVGHVAGGDRNRGIIIFVTIALTFWGGIAIGGVRTTVDPQQKKLWFMAQICTGTHAVAAFAWGEHERPADGKKALAYSQWDATEVALVYTGVAGLLNLLAILDALVRVETASRRRVPAMPGRSKVGVT